MKKLTAEKCRSQFDSWFQKNFPEPLFTGDERESLEVYTWLAWRDSQRQALEIAPPVLEQQESPTDTTPQIDNDGWIEWSGGVIPVDKLLMIEPRLRSGKVMPPEIALYWDWRKRNTDNDIIAYRVIESDGREG